MRLAFISDIHGNYTAFKAVLEDIKTQNVDEYICLGDTVTMGPQPKECLAELRNLKCTFIKGNHDYAVLSTELAEKYQIAAHLHADLKWCRDQLTQDDLNFIEAFHKSYTVKFPNGIEMLCFHGSPLSPIDIIQATTPPETIEKYFEGKTASVFIGGHSHIQMHRRYGNKLILNSGSVGNAFKFPFSPGNPPSLLPWAEYAIVSQSGSTLTVDLRRVYFDIDALMKTVAASGLPGSTWWQSQYKD
jgi:putative phosphoesterase